MRIRMLKRAWHGVLTEEESTAYANLGDWLDGMEATLTDGPWLLGEAFGLANITMALHQPLRGPGASNNYRRVGTPAHRQMVVAHPR